MEGIYHDKEFYKRSGDICMKTSNRYEKYRDWLDSFFANQVLDVLEASIASGDGMLRIIGVGTGRGKIEHDLLCRLLTRYSKVSNTVVEPTNAIDDYKNLVAIKPLPGVEWKWRQQTFDAFYRTTCQTSEIQKFHFVSALSVLYYMQDWKVEVMNMYNLLESGGVLMVTIVSEKSGYWKIWRRFPMLASRETVHINSSHVQAFLQNKEIEFEVVKQSNFVDITPCLNDEDEGGSTLVDFISHVKNFKTTAPPELRSDFMDYMFSPECSHKDNDRFFLDTSAEAIIVRKC